MGEADNDNDDEGMHYHNADDTFAAHATSAFVGTANNSTPDAVRGKTGSEVPILHALGNSVAAFSSSSVDSGMYNSYHQNDGENDRDSTQIKDPLVSGYQQAPFPYLPPQYGYNSAPLQYQPVQYGYQPPAFPYQPTQHMYQPGRESPLMHSYVASIHAGAAMSVDDDAEAREASDALLAMRLIADGANTSHDSTTGGASHGNTNGADAPHNARSGEYAHHPNRVSSDSEQQHDSTQHIEQSTANSPRFHESDAERNFHEDRDRQSAMQRPSPVNEAQRRDRAGDDTDEELGEHHGGYTLCHVVRLTR